MKNIFKKITLFSLLATPYLLSGFVSCSHVVCEKINLYSTTDTIRPGEQLQIRSVILPTGERNNNLDWQILTPIDGVSITSKGLLKVERNISVLTPQTITVHGSWKQDKNIFDEIDISLLPKATYNFQGFIGNEIKYVDRYDQPQCINIVQTSEFSYQLERPIDLFVFDNTLQRPEGFSSWFLFRPIVKDTLTNFMSFSLEGGGFQKHAIVWEPTYSDGGWTDKIPDFDTTTSALLYECVNVHFSCDPRVNLRIDFKTWQNPDLQLSPGRMSLVSQDVDCPYKIESDGVSGSYTSYVFCPSYSSSGIYKDAITTIYCYRPKYEYTDYRFQILMDPNLDPEIAKMFSVSISEPVIEEREFDHFRFFKIILSYSFDLNKRIHSAEYWNFEDIPLFTLLVIDPLNYTEKSPIFASYCRFFISWT